MTKWWRFSWHYNNENEKYEYKDGPKTKGSPWKNFRFWLYYEMEKAGATTRTVNIEWKVWTHFWHLYVKCGNNDEQVTITIACGLFSLWISFGNIVPDVLLPKKKCNPTNGKPFDIIQDREIGLAIHEGALHVNFWLNPMEWSSTNPWWWTFKIDPICFLIGKHEYQTVELYDALAPLPLPEQTYIVRVILCKSIRIRPRWFNKVSFFGKVKSDVVLPIPGKDGGVSEHFKETNQSGETIEEVIGNAVGYILKKRMDRWQQYEPR